MNNEIKWKKPDTHLCNQILHIDRKDKFVGSDCSGVNLFLLKDKYNIELAELDLSIKDVTGIKVYLRYYKGKVKNRQGYGYPIFDSFSDDIEKALIKEVLKLLLDDSKKNNRSLKFCLCSEEQCKNLDEAIHEICPEESFSWVYFAGDADYILNKKSWSHYVGKKFASKRNMVNTFIRNNPNWYYEELTKDKFFEYQKEYMEILSGEWFDSHNVEVDDMLKEERISLKHMLDNFNELMLVGGILYADKDTPAAFMIGSRINQGVYDAHFEKGLVKYVSNGAFVLLNKCFASSESLEQCEYINVEEDMGIEGLKNMKLSYHPEMILKKYYGGLRDE